MPSLVAEIGYAIEDHMKLIGMINTELDEHQKAFIEKKKAELEGAVSATTAKKEAGDYPASATVCTKCNSKAVVMMDGCMTCLACGDSKCG